jgi:hypothetical protein
MKRTIFTAAVLFFTLSVSALAQTSFTIASERPIVACGGLAEPVGAIAFTAVPVNPTDVTALGTITLTYTQPIANTGITLGQYGVQVQTTSGTAATLAAVTNVGAQGIVVITIPAGQTAAYKVRISNVRINVSTSCNMASAVVATAGSVGNYLTVGESDPIPVLFGILSALLPPAVTHVVINGSNGAIDPAMAIINVQEGFLNAFGFTSATDTTQTSGRIIRLTLSGTLPAGVTLNFPQADNSGLFVRSNATGSPAGSGLAVTSTSTPIYYVVNTDSSPVIGETLSINVGVSAVGPYPLLPGAVSVSAHIGPISPDTYYPRYAEGNGETAATRFLTVSQYPAAPVDFDGDSKTDITIWRPGSGVWYVLPSQSPGTYTGAQWGASTDKPVPGDYDGDWKSDVAVWRPSNGTWYVLPSTAPGTYMATSWGETADIAVPGDYDGDGKADIAVWRPSTGGWYVLPSSWPGTYEYLQWGQDGDVPVPGDYDGDRKADMAVWRPNTGTWFLLRSGSPGTYTSMEWGVNSDLPVPADYDDDEKTDVAIYRPSTGIWYILPTTNPGNYRGVPWGQPGDIPCPGDFYGVGKADIAVWRPGTGQYFLLRSGGTYTVVQWGSSGDIPISLSTQILGQLP